MKKQTLNELTQLYEPKVPDAAARINALSSDETFCDMCAEYEDCVRCLRSWAGTPANCEDRILEYRELIADLEEEILQYLQENGA